MKRNLAGDMNQLVRTLNGEYRAYFGENPGKVGEYLSELETYLREHNCTFKGSSMPTLLKPNFISGAQGRVLSESVETMSGALIKFIRLYLENRHVRQIMGFSRREEELFRIEPGYSNPLVISRLDAFLNDQSIRFLEFNCDSPAGIAYSDVMDKGFRIMLEKLPFLERYQITYEKRQDILLDALLESYRQFRSGHPGIPEKPVVAIVDWEDVSTYTEFQLHQSHFASNGIEAVIATPQDFAIRNGKAYAGGRRVDLVYRRVITRELIDKWEESGAFIQAIRKGLVCCCNSFRSYIVGNKKVLSVITDPRFNHVFSGPERELIRKTVPWTRVLADSMENYREQRVSLKHFVPENRERLVLKPSNQYGGKDVYIGKETSQSTWEYLMNTHLNDQSWVVQEYVDIPTDRYPEISKDVRFVSKYVNINPFSLNGRYSGTITRISDKKVINVSAGGGLVPTIEVRERGEGGRLP